MLDRVRPGPEDRSRLEDAAMDILSRVEEMAKKRGLSCRALLVGSAARKTWLKGDHDLDIFIAVEDGTDLKPALELAREVAPEHLEKYAEHAYVQASLNGFDVDLVPCYLLENASCLRSAVDRTPFHTKYISERIPGLEDEVLLLKQFLKGVGVYGSELRTGGFSGYLTELLILAYGSFLSVLKAASNWRPGEVIDIEDQASQPHEEPITVVDPVDPKRNVAAALTMDKMLQFVAAARCYLMSPELDFFFPPEIRPLSDRDLLDEISKRKSSLILVQFPAPPVVEDILFPQLRKAEESIRALLDRQGFRVLRSDVDWSHDSNKARMLFELEVWELSEVSRRIGPPVWEEEHLSRFLASHDKNLSGPYIEGGRAVVEVKRKYTRAMDALSGEIGNLALGKHLADPIRREHKLYQGSELIELEEREFRVFISKYFSAHLRMC